MHWIDSAFDGLKALGLCDREYPDAVFSIAYKDPASFNETPSCQTSIFQYKNFHIEWAQQVAYLYNRNQGVAWVGSKATLVCNREGYELIPEKTRDGILLADKAQLVGKFEDGGVEAHATNWCKCILNKSIETNSPIEKGLLLQYWLIWPISRIGQELVWYTILKQGNLWTILKRMHT